MIAKQSIISGFKNLYKGDNKIIQQSNNIAEIMNKTLDIITKAYDTTNIKPPRTPKSKAKDLYGYSQKNIIELVKAQNLKETIIKFKWIINILKTKVNNNLIIHNTSKIILKKKKQEINGYEDLRALSIMPAFIMSFDKIISAEIDKEIKEQLSVNQHGGKENHGTNTAKIAMLYNMEKKNIIKYY